MLHTASSDNDVHTKGVTDAGGYTNTRRNMLDIANGLHGTGIAMDIEIPMIAVIGSQSTGKSSLLENICGITLPRASGTCTRCPTECRLVHSDSPWNCIVSLRLTTDEHDRPITVRNVPFGDPIYDPVDVAERIRLAQLAILNPSRSVGSFLNSGAEPIVPETTFSKNCVSLEISGPDVVDLSFVDLPGLIASAGASTNDADIELVKELVIWYAKKESCIILLTVSCETEFENQGAYQVARAHDPRGQRTIGVLTKPDRAGRGDEERWVSLLRNDEPKLTLEHGWFSVKQPDTIRLNEGITREEARKEEKDFFASNKPWSTLPLKFQQRLGTMNLAERCGDVLSSLIAQRLPDIQKTIQEMLRTTESQLGELPQEPSKDPVGEVYNLVSKFSAALTRYVEGTPGSDGLLQTIRPRQLQFKEVIRKTAPDFRPFNKPEADVSPQDSITLTHPEFLSNEEHPCIPEDDSNAIYIDDVNRIAAQAITRELPDIYPFDVIQSFIGDVILGWEEPAVELFDHVEDILQSKIAEFVRAEFSQYPHLELSVSTVVADFITTRAQATKERLYWLLALEHRPRTLNDHYYRDYRDKFYAWYKGHRTQSDDKPLLEKLKGHQSDGGSDFDQAVTSIMSSFSTLNVNGIVPTDLTKVLPSDPDEAAILTMAQVRAYFQVAYKRFVDNIPNAIDHELILGLNRGQSLETVLRTELGVSGANSVDVCSEHLREDKIIAGQREELRNKRDRLNKARKELMRLRK